MVTFRRFSTTDAGLAAVGWIAARLRVPSMGSRARPAEPDALRAELRTDGTATLSDPPERGRTSDGSPPPTGVGSYPSHQSLWAATFHHDGQGSPPHAPLPLAASHDGRCRFAVRLGGDRPRRHRCTGGSPRPGAEHPVGARRHPRRRYGPGQLGRVLRRSLDRRRRPHGLEPQRLRSRGTEGLVPVHRSPTSATARSSSAATRRAARPGCAPSRPRLATSPPARATRRPPARSGWFRYAVTNHSSTGEFNRWHLMDLQRFALVPTGATAAAAPAPSGTPAGAPA